MIVLFRPGDSALTPGEHLASMADTLDAYADHGLRPTVLETAQIARTLRMIGQQIEPAAPAADTVVLPFPARIGPTRAAGESA